MKKLTAVAVLMVAIALIAFLSLPAMTMAAGGHREAAFIQSYSEVQSFSEVSQALIQTQSEVSITAIFSLAGEKAALTVADVTGNSQEYMVNATPDFGGGSGGSRPWVMMAI